MKYILSILFLIPIIVFGQTVSLGIGYADTSHYLRITNQSHTFPNPQRGTMLYILSDSLPYNPSITIDAYRSGVLGSFIRGRAASGSISAPAKALSEQTLFGIGGDGRGIDSFHNVSVGAFVIKAEADFSNTSAPTYLSLQNTASGSTTITERMRIASTGAIRFNSYGSGTFTGTPTKALQVDASGNIIEGALGGSATWGAITGTLSSQTDLNTALSGKVATTTTVNSHALSGNVTVTASDVSLGNVTNESKATMFTNPTLTGVSTINNINFGTQSITSAGGTTTLTVASPYFNWVTGTQTQTVQLPDATTLAVGARYYIDNNSTLAVTVKDGGANTISTLATITDGLYVLSNNSTTAGVWDLNYYGFNIAAGKVLTANNTITLAGTDGTTMTFPTTSATVARTDAANTFTGTQTFSGAIVTAAGTTGLTPINIPSSSVLRTSPSAGDFEYNGANLYFNPETTMGRGYVPDVQRFRLTANGSTIGTIANFFGTTSNPTLVAGAEYLIEIDMYYTNTTIGTVTWTFTNSGAPTLQNIHYRTTPAAGIPTVTAPAATYLEADVQGNTTAAFAIAVATSMTNATTQWAHFSIHLYNNTGTSLKIQATKLVGGTITPLAGSYWTCTRVPSSNTGTFSN